MKFNRKGFASLLCLSILLIFQTAFSQVRLPRLISDGMVLQRNADVKIWGWAAADEKIRINFRDKTYHTTADKNGDWAIILLESKAGGPYQMEIQASNQIILKNILIGDVWVCSGQSNMDLTMERVRPLYEDVIANSTNPAIRDEFLFPRGIILIRHKRIWNQVHGNQQRLKMFFVLQPLVIFLQEHCMKNTTSPSV